MPVATVSTAASPALHPLLERLLEELQAPALDVAGFDAWTQRDGAARLVFTEDPQQHRETIDLAVIVPELAQALAGRFRTDVLLPAAARALASRYALRRRSALVLLIDRSYVGAIDGLRDWKDYLDEMTRLLAAEPTRPPSIGIAVTAAASKPAACPDCP